MAPLRLIPFLPAILPAILKDLLQHLPSLVFQVTDWDSIRRELPLLSKRLLTQAGVPELSSAQSKTLSQFVIFASTSLPKFEEEANRQSIGDALLRYYFAQFYCEEGLFLDLRLLNFRMQGQTLLFKPNGLWTQFTPKFRTGITLLYEGFYFENEQNFEAGLNQTGLLSSDWSESDQNEIKNLFKTHFGKTIDAPMQFSLNQFQETFLQIFEFLMRKKVKLTCEFALFGIMLVTLYLSLEQLQTQHEVARLFKDVIKEVKKSK